MICRISGHFTLLKLTLICGAGPGAGFFTQISQGVFSVDITTTPEDNQAIFDGGSQTNDLCLYFLCMSPTLPIYGQNPTTTSRLNVVQVVRNFQAPTNHAYNLTIEQELNNKVAFSVAYVGTAGRDLVNWRDLNACPVSNVEDIGCDETRQPFGTSFPNLNHILQLNNDGYSNYNSLQTAFKVRDVHGLTGQFNFTWSRAFDTGSANRGGTFLSNAQNPYNVDKGYAPSDFDTPWNVNFTLVYEMPRVHALPRLLGEGWQLNSLFRAQMGRPFSIFASGDPTNQGLRNALAFYDGSSLNYNFDARGVTPYFNTAAFHVPDLGTIGNGRNVARQPGCPNSTSVFSKTSNSMRGLRSSLNGKCSISSTMRCSPLALPAKLEAILWEPSLQRLMLASV